MMHRNVATTESHGGHHSAGGESGHDRSAVVPGGDHGCPGLFPDAAACVSGACRNDSGGAVAPAHHAWLPVAAWHPGRAGHRSRPGSNSVAENARQIGWVEQIPLLADLFGQRWYLDRFYRYLLDTLVYRGVSRLFTANDRRVIDGALDGLGRSTIGLGRVVDWVHSGMIQYRLMIMFAAVIGLILFIGWGG
jgi:hypothetical protein